MKKKNIEKSIKKKKRKSKGHSKRLKQRHIHSYKNSGHMNAKNCKLMTKKSLDAPKKKPLK